MDRRQEGHPVGRPGAERPVRLQEEASKTAVRDASVAALRDFPDLRGRLDAAEIDRLDRARRPDEVDRVPLVIDVEAFRTGDRALQSVDAVDQVEDDVDAEVPARPFADRRRAGTRRDRGPEG